MGDVIRCQVDDDHGATVLYVDQVLDQLDTDDREQLVTDVRAMIAHLGPDGACEVLAVVAQSTADQHAYQREAARRGVLGL